MLGISVRSYWSEVWETLKKAELKNKSLAVETYAVLYEKQNSCPLKQKGEKNAFFTINATW